MFKIDRSIEITTKIGCQNRCVYCPQERFIRAYSERSSVNQMSLDTFKRCLANIPKDVVLNFSGFTEPFLNKECVKMILFANQSGYKINVYTTLVGLSVDDVDLLEEVDFGSFLIHLPDKRGNTEINVDGKYLELVDKISKSRIKIDFACLEGFRNLHPKLKPIIERKVYSWHKSTRAGNLEKGKNRRREKRALLKCKMANGNLLPNGDVILCCYDWGIKHVLGNLMHSSYDSLLGGEEYLKVMKGLDDSSLDILCRYCEIPDVKGFSIKKMLRKIVYKNRD